MLVLLNLSAAFDTINHKFLLDILEHRLGITGLVVMWYQFYLADRTQTFRVGSDCSIAFAIDCSVPQGSVLGPLKFGVYTEDLPVVTEKQELAHHLYADDTQIADHLQLRKPRRLSQTLNAVCSLVMIGAHPNARSPTQSKYRRNLVRIEN